MSHNRIRRPRARLDRLSGAAGSSLVVGRVDEASRQAVQRRRSRSLAGSFMIRSVLDPRLGLRPDPELKSV